MKFSRDAVRTGGVGDRETTDLDRRSADGVGLHWKVKEVDYSKTPPVYRAERGDPNDEDNYNLTDWLPAAGHRAQGDVETHFLEVGERVTMLSEGGELATGMLLPSGTYTKDEERKAGTDKPGVRHFKSKNGQEISFDRETGAYRVIAKGQKKDDSTSSTGGSGAQARAAADDGGSKEIKGSVEYEAADGTFSMKDGVITGTMGDKAKFTLTKDTFATDLGGSTFTMKKGSIEFSLDGVTFKFSGAGFEQTGGDQKHDGHGVGKTHRHKDTQTGAGMSGEPQ